MRGDCLGILGHPVVETPHLDTMAHNGAIFTNAYSAVPSCIASRAAIMTGLSQKSHGRVGYEDRVEWNYDHYLAGELAKAGYHTQAIGKMHVHPARFLCGFHNVILHDGYLHTYRSKKSSATESWFNTDDYLPWLREKLGYYNADIIDAGLDCNSWVARSWPYPEHLHPTNWLVDQSIDFLRRRDPTKPFFLMMSFVRPHSPLDPPQYYYDMYINREMPAPPIGDWVEEEDDGMRDALVYNGYGGKLTDSALQRARAAYYGSITHIDHQIGRFLQAMFDEDVLDNTIILFTSDHGDMMGDHNWVRKSIPYEGSTSIPFIIYDPGNNLGIKSGAVINNIVELKDIMPTLLDAAGVEIPEKVEGMSVMPLAREEETPWREYLHGEHSFGVASNHYIVTKKDKYIWYSQTGEEQYFDLEKDPMELHNGIKDKEYSHRINYLRKILIKELEGREEGYSDGNRLIVGCSPKSSLSHIKEDS
ncbi:MAG: arylsulfatase [Clostridiales bacterium]|nr:arylsulfatase [Clostridiales bacterium]